MGFITDTSTLIGHFRDWPFPSQVKIPDPDFVCAAVSRDVLQQLGQAYASNPVLLKTSDVLHGEGTRFSTWRLRPGYGNRRIEWSCSTDLKFDDSGHRLFGDLYVALTIVDDEGNSLAFEAAHRVAERRREQAAIALTRPLEGALLAGDPGVQAAHALVVDRERQKQRAAEIQRARAWVSFVSWRAETQFHAPKRHGVESVPRPLVSGTFPTQMEAQLTQRQDVAAILRNLDPNRRAAASGAPVDELMPYVDMETPVRLPLSFAEMEIIRTAIERCWFLPPSIASGKDVEKLVVDVTIKLDSDGTVLSAMPADPGFMTNSDYAVVARSIVRAALLCSPLTGLTRDRFNAWESVTLRFNLAAYLH